nr:2-C-methyl-D-erythritol 2,4-cyclodiphosphate synthase [Mariprofundus ferrinatatus]
MKLDIRIGHGFDVHAFAKGRKLILGGVEVPYEMGLAGHSDADVLIHALCDALLGAAGMNDIGHHFPDSDMQYKDADSTLLLVHVMGLLREKGWGVGNVDITLMAQAPKLASYIGNMRARMAGLLQLEQDAVNIKATTTEKLGFVGRKEGIACEAVALIAKL